MADAEVRVASGVVRGRSGDGVAVFLGVPFAAAPVGELRFAAPRPVAAWDGVREAVAYGPPPPQPGQPYGGDEWLTANVFTPDHGAGAGLPVMVWVHGGGFTIGVSGEYDGRRLAAEQHVVVVTFNYRVGFEGYGLVDGAPANRGLLDQVAALEWVRENIRGFGGDPGRVTVFGESAGAGSIAALLAMPRADGLFGRAIASSVTGPVFSVELAGDIARECLRDGADDLVAAAERVRVAAGEYRGRWGSVAERGIVFAPVVDGEVLPETPWQALARGRGRGVELMVGHTRDEHRLFSLILGVLGQVTEELADEALRWFAPDPQRYRELYPDPERRYETVHGDWLFRMPSLKLAEAQVAGGGRAHLFEVTWGGPLGACHGIDVPLVFGTLDRGPAATIIGGDPAAEQVSAQLRSAWAAFARDGEPGWAAFEGQRRLTRLFDVPPQTLAYPEEASRQIWAGHEFTALPLLRRQ